MFGSRNAHPFLFGPNELVLIFGGNLLQMQLVTVDDVLMMMGDTSNLGEKGELEKLIEAVGRVFSTNDGSDYIPYPTGYSGEVNKVRVSAYGCVYVCVCLFVCPVVAYRAGRRSRWLIYRRTSFDPGEVEPESLHVLCVEDM